MWIFDSVLLIAVSALLGFRSPYLGILTFILGIFVEFQAKRVLFLLGERPKTVPASRKVKSAILAVLFGACLIPLVGTGQTEVATEGTFDIESLLPLVVIVGLLSSVLMSALSTEKRKR